MPSFLVHLLLALPAGTNQNHVPKALQTPPENIIDMHCHVAGIGAGGSGCFLSEELRSSLRFKAYLSSFNVSLGEVEKKGDAVIADKIAATLGKGHFVRRAVVLALDGVIDDKGELDRSRTEMYVPNEYVLSLCRAHPELLYGASINPRRSDALARLEEARAKGAVLIKWLPPLQDIDPGNPAFGPFYRKMAELGLPLLSHTGRERAFTKANESLGDPERLRFPLSQGVKVIAAHAGIPGSYAGESGLDRLCRLAAEYPNLYVDISSLTQINKRSALQELLSRKELEGRLVYGTDYPLIAIPGLCSPWMQVGNVRLGSSADISRIKNPWDRDYALKRALGVPDSAFRRFETLMPPRR